MMKIFLLPVLPILMVVALVASRPVSADIDSLLSWELNDGPDSQVTLDSSGTENHGLLGSTDAADDSDPQWIDDGAGGQALHFDGGDFLALAKTCCLEPDALTIELRVRSQGPPASSPRFLAVHRPAGCEGGTYSLFTSQSPDHHGRTVITFSIRTTEESPTASPRVECLSNLWDGRWHHVAGTFNPDLFGGLAILYVDGIIRAFSLHRGRIDYSSADDRGFYVGGPGPLPGPCGPGFEGDIDDVRISSRALWPLEVFRRARGDGQGVQGPDDGDEAGDEAKAEGGDGDGGQDEGPDHGGWFRHRHPPVAFPLDTPVDIAMGPGRSEYCFRIQPPPGKPLILSLEGDAAVGPTSLLVRWGGPAKPDHFDQMASGPVPKGVKLVIPSARDDVLNGLIKLTSAAPSDGTVTLTIHPAELFLEDLSSSLAGSGALTAASVIRGGGFDDTTQFYLLPAGCDPSVCEPIPSTQVVVVTTSRAETEFVIEGAPVGLYDLVATKDDGLHTAILPGAFEVKDLLPEFTSDAALRTHRFYRKRDVGRITIIYSNPTDHDRAAPLFLLKGPPGSEMRLERDREYQGSEIQVLGIQPGGVPGVLSPGTIAELVVYYRLNGDEPESTFRLFVFAPGSGDVLDWTTVELPPQILPDRLDEVRIALAGRFGSTWLGYLSNIRSLANRLSRRGADAASVKDLFRFAVRDAYGRPSSAILGRIAAPVTGDPLAGLRVVALDLEGAAPVTASSALTDANGSYALDWLEGGHAYQVGIVDFNAVAGPVTAPPGADLYRFDLTATPAPGNGLAAGCANCDESGLPAGPLALPESLLQEVPESSQAVRLVSAKDPNEKEGSGGQGDVDLGFVGPGDAIQYQIHFQNVGSAGVRTLIINDTLDAGLDFSSVQLNDVRSSNQEPVPLDTCQSEQESGYTCSPSLDTFSPERLSNFIVPVAVGGSTVNLGVNIAGAVSGGLTGGPGSQRIQWVLDQTTQLGPDLAEVGFLMPGETGYVSFTASPLADLAEGTEIQNQAEISFDGDVMVTGIVTSTFSQLPRPQLPNTPVPASDPQTLVSPDVKLAWFGDGATSWDVLILYAENGQTRTIEANGLTTRSFCPQGLVHDRIYSWQVTARNSRGITTEGPLWSFQTESPVFRRADANGDGAIDLSDALFTVFYLFGGRTTSCQKSLDFDGNGAIEVTDAVLQLGYLFLNGREPAAPFLGCGTEPPGSDLTCTEYPSCGVRQACR
jgi:uncharacterized repeat protein (TIGR01451 family)